MKPDEAIDPNKWYVVRSEILKELIDALRAIIDKSNGDARKKGES